MTEVHLSSFNTGNFNKGAGFIKQTLWYFVNALFVRASWNPFMGIKVFFLKLFGAKIGKGLVINLKSATTRLYDTEAKIICIVSKKGAQCIECHHKDI